MGLPDQIKQLTKLLADGGAFCIHCGLMFQSVREARKHYLASHYDYCLAQCNGNKESLRSWAAT